MSQNAIRRYRWALALTLGVVFSLGYGSRPSGALHVIGVRSVKDLKEFLRYTPDRIPFVSAHRGGPRPGFPENCLATFENTLRHTWAILEVDPRYTRDSAIVLMHDVTLDRTTTGHGRVADYTLQELKKLRLKDTEGRITDYTIPTLGEALEWAKGKTVLVIDQKDVPMAARMREIKKYGAEANALVMAYTYEDARLGYTLDTAVVMEVFIPDRAAAQAFERTGVPWKNTLAFVTHTQPKDSSVFDYLHARGVMGIRGSSRTIDKDFTAKYIPSGKLAGAYHTLIDSGADVIEADLAIEAGLALMQRPYSGITKAKFFQKIP